MKSLIKTFFLMVTISPLFLSAESNEGASSKDLSSYLKVSCTDHVQHFEKLFKYRKISHFLEFGLGIGTKYYLDNCNKVTSVELIVGDINVEWLNRCKELYAQCGNWKVQSIDIRKHPVLHKGHLRARNKHNPNKLKLYTSQVVSLVDTVLKENKAVDLAFVDSGFVPRADLVQALFGKVKIIAAHDTNLSNLFAVQRGWNRITTPSNYTKVHFSKGKGVTFWIENTLKNLIAQLHAESLKGD